MKFDSQKFRFEYLQSHSTVRGVVDAAFFATISSERKLCLSDSLLARDPYPDIVSNIKERI